jgi:hypothetical protein
MNIRITFRIGKNRHSATRRSFIHHTSRDHWTSVPLESSTWFRKRKQRERKGEILKIDCLITAFYKATLITWVRWSSHLPRLGLNPDDRFGPLPVNSEIVLSRIVLSEIILEQFITPATLEPPLSMGIGAQTMENSRVSWVRGECTSRC